MSSERESDDAKSGSGRKERRNKGAERRLRAPVHYLAYVLIALALVLVDPLRWQEATSNASQDLAYRMLIGPLYPADHQDDIAVVLFNEATLKDRGSTWPVAMKTHADILKTIRCMRPRGVMVDFVFPDQRDDPTVTELRDEIQAYKDEDIPLYFARAEGTNLDWIRPELSNAALTSIVAPVSDGVSRNYELCSKLPGDGFECACEAGLNAFQACPRDVGAGTHEPPVALTAAFQMFESAHALPSDFDVRRPKTMDVVWSNRFNEINDKWMRKQTSEGLQHLCLEIGSGVWDWLKRMWFQSDAYSFRQTCPYTTTVPAHGVLRAPDDPLLRKALSGNFVFYGADLAGLEDTVVPPTHVKLPGVFLHAMALDNLLTFDGRYKHSFFAVQGAAVSAQHLTTAVAVLIALVVVAFARSARFAEAQSIKVRKERGLAYVRVLWRRWGFWILFNLGALVVILLAFWLLYTERQISPKNWLGYWGLMVALSGMAKGQAVEGFLRRIAKHLAPALKPVLFTEKRR